MDALGRRVDEFLAAKRPGDVDIAEVQDAKRIIRETEAVAGIRTLGLEDGAARFLNLPFYQTGKVKKDPVGPADVRDRARACSRSSRPTWCSWPATSPTRTAPTGCARRRSTGRSPSTWRPAAAGRRSGSTAAPGRSGRSPRPTWLVPLSQEELRLKIQAIFKHQSQKDSRAVPRARTSASSGSGSRRGTRAPRRSSTGSGLAEYFAMEAYVVER